MLQKLKSLGYVKAELARDTLLGSAGTTLRGHDYHYSCVVSGGLEADGWHPAFRLSRIRSDSAEMAGLCKGSVLASYVHVHFASCEAAAVHFLKRCKGET